MPSSRKKSPATHPVVITFLIFAIVAFMYFTAEVLKPLALAILLAFAMAPIAGFLERKGLPRFLSVISTLLVVLGTVGFLGFKVSEQLASLGKDLPEYQKRILAKIDGMHLNKGPGVVQNIEKFASDLSQKIAPVSEAERDKDVSNVRVVNESKPNLFRQVADTAGPYLESLGVFAFVLILTMFILNTREDLGDRLIRLFGSGKLSLTTKTMAEVGERISRYIVTFAAVNSTVGVIVGVGLAIIGLPFALVWGILAAMLRFVPYVGPATAFVLPFAFSFAYFPKGSWGPFEVLMMFLVLEALFNSVLEPVIYGKTTGVSSLGLLVAAMFWTWLWGALGLLLSTPLTVCLAVMGKYVPALKVFATFLGEEAPLNPDVRFYQRILAGDQDGATEFVEEVLQEKSRSDLFDDIFIPTLAMLERDSYKENIDDAQRDFAWYVIEEILEDLEETPAEVLDDNERAHAGPIAEVEGSGVDTGRRIVAIPSNDKGDLLALNMLQVLLAPSGCKLELTEIGESPLAIVERLEGEKPRLVVISHLPPAGLAAARYLVRRLRAGFSDVPILVGRWSESTEGASVERLSSTGGTKVVGSLADARDRILDWKPVEEGKTPALSKIAAS